MQDTVLFYSENCGYCHKVLQFMDENDIIISQKNISTNSLNRVELKEIAGKTQVPCLIINNEPMWESDDIIQWMKDNLKE